jgi:hypothetical protein
MIDTNKLQLSLIWTEEEHSRDAGRRRDEFVLSGSTLRHEHSEQGAHSAGTRHGERRSIPAKDLQIIEGILRQHDLLVSRAVQLPGRQPAVEAVDIELRARFDGQEYTLKIHGPRPEDTVGMDGYYRGAAALRDTLESFLPEPEA